MGRSTGRARDAPARGSVPSLGPRWFYQPILLELQLADGVRLRLCGPPQVHLVLPQRRTRKPFFGYSWRTSARGPRHTGVATRDDHAVARQPPRWVGERTIPCILPPTGSRRRSCPARSPGRPRSEARSRSDPPSSAPEEGRTVRRPDAGSQPQDPESGLRGPLRGRTAATSPSSSQTGSRGPGDDMST
jgi:hypothetical protein